MRSRPMVDPGAAVIVDVAAIGGHLGRADDQVAREVVLVATDLAEAGGRVVVEQGDEVEPGPLAAEWSERVLERLPHARVARLLLAVDVEIARVPVGLPSHRAGVVVGGPVGAVRPGTRLRQLDLQAKGDRAVGVAFELRGDRGDPQLGGPATARNRARLVAPNRPAADVGLSVGLVDGPVRIAVLGDADVADRRAGAAAQLPVRPARHAARLRLVDREVDHVLRSVRKRARRCQLRLVVAVADPDSGRPLRYAKRDVDVAPLEVGLERP